MTSITEKTNEHYRVQDKLIEINKNGGIQELTVSPDFIKFCHPMRFVFRQI